MECVSYNGSNYEQAVYGKIYDDYHGVHGYVATVLCGFGLVANFINILVLTRSEMFSTINMLLTAIAVCDTSLMFFYIVYLAHFQLRTYECPGLMYTYGWALFTVFYADISVTLRACSLWLSVVMAALRSHILSRHQVLLLQSRYIANKRLGYKLIVSTVISVIVMTVPVFAIHTVSEVSTKPYVNNVTCPRSAWIVVPPSVTVQNDCLLLKFGYWTNGLLLKLIPCVLLSYYLFKLIHFIRVHMQHSQSRFGERETMNSLKPTTFLLSTILFVTLLCELPNALASLFSGVRSFAYGVMIYKYLGDIFDLLALVNGITSFILYCSMSQMFRETFFLIMCEIRAYFTMRNAYYRRWSLMFGASQSVATDLHSEHNGFGDDRGPGQHPEVHRQRNKLTASPQQKRSRQQSESNLALINEEHPERQSLGDILAIAATVIGQESRQESTCEPLNTDDRHRLLQIDDSRRSARLSSANYPASTPSPSQLNSKPLLTAHDGDRASLKKSRIPLFDYINLNVFQSRSTPATPVRNDDEPPLAPHYSQNGAMNSEYAYDQPNDNQASFYIDNADVLSKHSSSVTSGGSDRSNSKRSDGHTHY